MVFFWYNMYTGRGFMEKYVLPSFVIKSIDDGKICDNIVNILNSDDIYADNNKVFRKFIPIILRYAKAYMVYVISSFIINSDSIKYIEKRNLSEGSNEYFDNYLQLESSLEAIYEEITILFDILKKASATDSQIQADYIKSQLDYVNIMAFSKNPELHRLDKYTNIISKTIDELSLTNTFKINKSELINLTKYYLLSKEDLSDEEYICGSSNFMYNAVLDAYSLFEEYISSYQVRINNRNEDREKVQELQRIIKKHRF